MARMIFVHLPIAAVLAMVAGPSANAAPQLALSPAQQAVVKPFMLAQAEKPKLSEEERKKRREERQQKRQDTNGDGGGGGKKNPPPVVPKVITTPVTPPPKVTTPPPKVTTPPPRVTTPPPKVVPPPKVTTPITTVPKVTTPPPKVVPPPKVTTPVTTVPKVTTPPPKVVPRTTPSQDDYDNDRARPMLKQRPDDDNDRARPMLNPTGQPRIERRDERIERRDDRRDTRIERRDDRADRIEARRRQVRLDELRTQRRRDVDRTGRTVIVEPGRTIIRDRDSPRTIIRVDETERLRRLTGRDARFRRNFDGTNRIVVQRPRGEVVTITSRDGRILRRFRRTPDGREVVIIDNSRHWRRWATTGVVVGAVTLGALALTIPRRSYAVEYRRASERDVYETLSAPPLEALPRRYSLEEVVRSHDIRSRVRRIDIDTITFDSGSWEIDVDQYPTLERLARTIQRVLDDNPNEVFLIEGHTDPVGEEDDNLSLSDRRAEAVAEILIEEFGIPAENIVTQGYGEQYVRGDAEEADRSSRRVSIRRITPLLDQPE